uniref:Uncharacterized protein n=1 Tax=Salix viminalis TaxID=40686 RepID=A0A6N2KDI6_SALVM
MLEANTAREDPERLVLEQEAAPAERRDHGKSEKQVKQVITRISDGSGGSGCSGMESRILLPFPALRDRLPKQSIHGFSALSGMF